MADQSDLLRQLDALPTIGGSRQQTAAAARRGAELGMPPQSGFVADVLLRSGLGQGLLMGAGDEVEAFFRSRLGSQTYDQALEEVRRRMAVTRQERPGQTTAAEIAGAAWWAVRSAPLRLWPAACCGVPSRPPRSAPRAACRG